MLSIFRTNQSVANILLLVYALVVRFAVFFRPDHPQLGYPAYLSEQLYEWIDPFSKVGIGLAALLVVIQAILINVMVSRFRLAQEISLFPGLFFVLFSSLFPSFLYLSPLHLANTFFVFLLIEIFTSYRKYSAAINIFNAGLWAAMASLFHVSYLFLFLVAFLGFSVVRSYKVKEWLMLLSGFIVPFFLLGTISYIIDDWNNFYNIQFIESFAFFDVNGQDNVRQYIRLGLLGFGLLVSVGSYGIYTRKTNIQVQKFINILYLSMLCALLPFLYQTGIQVDQILIITIPLSILLSINFLHIRPALAEALHFILLICTLVLQFYFLL